MTMDQNTTSLGFVGNSVRQFFYREEVPYGLAAIRILLPLILLCVVIPRWQYAREFYSTDGAAAPLAVNYGVENFPPEPSGTAAVAMMTALAFGLVATAIGWHTRLSLVLTWGLYTYLNMLDSLSTFTKYSVISSHVLLLLCLSNCGAVWSVDYWRKKNREKAAGCCSASAEQATNLKSPVWPRRLLQLLIGLVYFGAAFTKMHTDGFMTSDQIRYWLITNMNNTNPLGEYLAMYPSLIIAMSHIAIVWQILFVFITWRGPSRLIMLGIGALFHLSTIWLLGLFIFPPIMITTYLAWLSEEDVHWIRRRVLLVMNQLRGGVPKLALPAGHGYWQTVSQMTLRFPLPSLMLFCLLLTTSVCVGMEIEYRIDRYGHRRPEGPYQLTPMSEERVAEMFHGAQKMREADKFFSLEIGTETLGNVVVHRRYQYQAGESVVVQCTLVPPHEDLWVECRFINSDGQQLTELAQPATRDMLRLNFMFQFPQDLPPGTYRFVIHSNGDEVLSRSVSVGTR